MVEEKAIQTFMNVKTTVIAATEKKDNLETRIALMVNSTEPDFLYRRKFYLYENFDDNVLDVSRILKKADKIVYDCKDTYDLLKKYYTFENEKYVFFYLFAKSIISEDKISAIGDGTIFDIYSLMFNEQKNYDGDYSLFEVCDCCRQSINGLLLYGNLRNNYQISNVGDNAYISHIKTLMKQPEKVAVVNYINHNGYEYFSASKPNSPTLDRILISSNDDESRQMLKEFLSDIEVLIVYDSFNRPEKMVQYLHKIYGRSQYFFSIIDICKLQKELFGNADIGKIELLVYYFTGFEYLYKCYGIELLNKLYDLVELMLADSEKCDSDE